MAQNITLMGASYNAVPAVTLPKTGGGTARFDDASITTATASDVAQGKLFLASDGTITTGTASGGGDDGSFKAVIERTATTPTLPGGLTYIGAYAFHSCSNLALTSLPDSITSIGTYAFYGCTRLALMSLPNGIKFIGAYAFYGCTRLALTSLPSDLTSVGANAFYGCQNLALTSLPSGVTSIGTYAFYNCAGLTSIACDGAITSLGAYAFTCASSSYAMQLASASFPNMAVSSLGMVFGYTTADRACKKLAFADVGKTKAFAANAFANCNSLSTLVLRRTDSICALNNVSAFLNTPLRGYGGATGTVYVPQALIPTYQAATNWKTLYEGGTLSFAAIEGSEYEI